ncbi:unnamed protein product, partial [Polarella glacialis]
PAGSPTVEMFTTRGCTLCEKLRGLLDNLRQEVPHTLLAVDITDPDKVELWEEYRFEIPVLHINGSYCASSDISQ